MTKKTRVFHVYEDPGHGWIKVKKSMIHDLGLTEEISSFSYQYGEYAFLEEDRDAGLFIHALRKAGIKPSYRSHHTNKQSKIRGYSRYNKIPF